MKAIIDRFEDEIAVVEIEGRMRNIPRHELPTGAKEGDALIFEAGKWKVSLHNTEKIKKKMDDLAEKLWEN